MRGNGLGLIGLHNHSHADPAVKDAVHLGRVHAPLLLHPLHDGWHGPGRSLQVGHQGLRQHPWDVAHQTPAGDVCQGMNSGAMRCKGRQDGLDVEPRWRHDEVCECLRHGIARVGGQLDGGQ